MIIQKVMLYICYVICFLVTTSAIMSENKRVAIGGSLAMATITGIAFYLGL
jgi:hypothetical protein